MPNLYPNLYPMQFPNRQREMTVNFFESWREQRNLKVCNSKESHSSRLKVIQNCLDVMVDEELYRNMALFVCEVRKTDGSKYPPNTLHGIVASIQRFFKGKGKPVRFFNDDKFVYLKDVLDTNSFRFESI